MMEKRIPLLAAMAALAAVAAYAQFPAQDMDRRSLGLGYTFALRGQNITDARVASHEVIHMAGFAYAPVPYLALQAGLGVDRFSVSPYNQVRFRGGYGFTPAFGASAYSPFFAMDMLRGTTGVHLVFMGSEDDRGYRYSALISNPFLGLIVSPTVFLDVTLGARLHLMDGTMSSPRSTARPSFANDDIGRGYLSFTLKTPFERAFVNLDMDLSPQVDFDWSEGPREASVAVTFGTILGWKGKSQPKGREEKPTYFPAYPEMKDRQDKMAEELE